MTHTRTPLKLWITSFVITMLLVSSVLLLGVCKSGNQSENPIAGPGGRPTYDSLKNRHFSWNILFNDSATLVNKYRMADTISLYIKRYYDSCNKVNKTKFTANVATQYCPCDSTLFTIDVVIGGEGESPTPPTNPNDKLKGGGDLAGVFEMVQENLKIKNSEASIAHSITREKRVPFLSKPVIDSFILAIIDTGIDSTLFKPETMKLIWHKQSGITLYNFLPGENSSNYFDDHEYKHGSAVTTIALKALKTSNYYPRLMILKALDKDKTGTIFSVSCALSYAAQNNATVVNASLGYYSDGPVDPVLKKYVLQCTQKKPKPTLVFAAAGNVEAEHHLDKLCDAPEASDRIGSKQFFYPAYMGAGAYLISVTQLRDQRTPCRYQNAGTNITMGVVVPDTGSCCKFKVPFNRSYYEGTSFATPAASGTMVRCIIDHHGFNDNTFRDWMLFYIKPASASTATSNGEYINFSNE